MVKRGTSAALAANAFVAEAVPGLTMNAGLIVRSMIDRAHVRRVLPPRIRPALRCDHGTKCNVQGYKVSWNGYKPMSTRPSAACRSPRCR